MAKVCTACDKLALYSPLLMRLAVGAILVFAAIAKFQKGAEATLEAVKGMAPDWLPEGVATVYGYGIPYLELIVGILIVVGLFTKVAALVAGLMSITYLIAAGVWLESMGIPSWNWLLLAVCIHFWTRGAGDCSIDRMMGKQ